ncbi:MAG: VanZ family protein [Ruminococcaceae bacterium]|nr:VanZ family protein [Oscillospiraceae bacterium]
MSILFLIPGVMLFSFYTYISFIASEGISGVFRMCILLSGCLFIYLYSVSLCKKNKDKAVKIMKYTFIFFFLIYIVFLLDMLFFDSYFGRNREGQGIFSGSFSFKELLKDNMNIIPFATIISFFRDFSFYRFIVNILGNLLAFAPLGFFYPLIFKKMNSPLLLVAGVASTVFIIESAQLLFSCGSFDVDDVILNTLGAYLIYTILKIPPLTSFVNKLTSGGS